MQLDCETTSLDDVTLVTAHLHNDTPVARRVRLQNRLDGPVLPPRTEGVPEAGWDDGGYETVVAAESTVAVGYACPAPECDPAAVVTVDERALDDDSEQASGARSPDGVVRRLGTAVPPRDAIPPSRVGSVASASNESTAEQCDAAVTTSCLQSSATEPSTTRLSRDSSDTPDDADLPDSLASWFASVERRIDRAERLTDPSVQAATGVLSEVGGLDTVDGLQSTVDADAEALRAVADRARTLADRAEKTDVALSALRRLA